MLEVAKRYRCYLGQIRDALQKISRGQAFFLYIYSLPVVAARLSACTKGLFLWSPAETSRPMVALASLAEGRFNPVEPPVKSLQRMC